MTALPAQIEERLTQAEPAVEVLLVEVLGETVRVFIDHPEGVTLDLCERVTQELSDLREQYALEVSSPGAERPLTKPEHFRRFVGRRARVRVRGDEATHLLGGGAAPLRSFTGELVGADESSVTLAAPTGVVAIPYAAIRRCNLVEE